MSNSGKAFDLITALQRACGGGIETPVYGQDIRFGELDCHACNATFAGIAPSALDDQWKQCPFCDARAAQFWDLPTPDQGPTQH